MSFPTRLLHTITIFQQLPPGSGDVDLYGNPDEVLDTGTAWPAWVSPSERVVSQSEFDVDRQTSITLYKVHVGADVGVDAISYVEWEGRRHEVVGRPFVYSARNGDHHTEFMMRLEEG